MKERYGDISVSLEGHVALVEIHRPPHNYFDEVLIRDLAVALEDIDAEHEARVSLLCSEGRSFCAGGNFSTIEGASAAEVDLDPSALYREAVRLFECRKPIVAAIQGAAIGGGLGVALVADFRVVCPEARFVANFVKLGIHPGFGASYTLPRLIGQQKAALMNLTGRPIDGKTAVAWGLADVMANRENLRDEALKLAAEIAAAAPLAVESTRKTQRAGLAEAVRRQTEVELGEQKQLFNTEDHVEGVRAIAERREGRFKRR